MNLTGFLRAKYARIFMQELWDLLLSAQQNIGGIPTVFLEKKKEEIRKKKVRKRNVCLLLILYNIPESGCGFIRCVSLSQAISATRISNACFSRGLMYLTGCCLAVTC